MFGSARAVYYGLCDVGPDYFMLVPVPGGPALRVLAYVGRIPRAAVRGVLAHVRRIVPRVSAAGRHGINRAIGDGAKRAGVKPKAILDALKTPSKIVEGVDGLGRPFQVFHGSKARVVVNPQTGKIVAVNPVSRARPR